MAEYQKLVDDRQKQTSASRVPLPLKVDRFPLPAFVEGSVGNNPNQHGTMSPYLKNSTAAGSSSRLDAQFSKRLVSSIINDIQSKIVQIPPALQDKAVKHVADTQAKSLLMSSHYYESVATRLLEQVFNLCDRASRAELERDMAIKEKDKAQAHERSMGEHYDIVTVQVEDIFNGRLQAARNLAGESGAVASSTDGNPTEVQGANSPPSADYLDKQVVEAGKRRKDEDEEEELDEDPIRDGKRRATIGAAHKSQPTDTQIFGPNGNAAATPDESKTIRIANLKPDAHGANTDHHALRTETVLARLARPSPGGKSQVVPQKRPKQASPPSSKYRSNTAQKQSKVKVARNTVVAAGDMNSPQADSDTIEVEAPATKVKKGKEKAVEEDAPFIPYESESESDDSVVFLGPVRKQAQKASTISDACVKRRDQDMSEEEESTADENDGFNYSDDEKGPATKHQRVNNKGAYVAVPLNHSHRTIASAAASIPIIVELRHFQPDRNNTYTLERVYQIPPSMAATGDELRSAVEDFGRDDKVLLEDRRFVYGSQLMIKTVSGAWLACEKLGDYRAQVRSYRNQVQTAVAKGGWQDDVEVNFRCMVYPEGDAGRARAAFGNVI